MRHSIQIEADGKIITASTSYLDTLPKTGIEVERRAIIAEDYYDTVNKRLAKKIPHSFTINKESVIADGEDTICISNLPIPSYLSLNHSYISKITDGEIELTYDIPGEHHISIETAKYLLYEVTINAT